MPVKLDYALYNDELVHISEDIQKSFVYNCPVCKEVVISRKGSERKHHFAHDSGSNCSANNETLEHYYAKHLIRKVILQAKKDTNNIKNISIMRNCQICEYEANQKIPLNKISDVIVEKRIEGKGGYYIADVALIDESGKVLCVVEIKKTHAVDLKKEEKLEGTPWIELDAADVIDSPMKWIPLTERNLRFYKCECDNQNDKNFLNEYYAKVPLIRDIVSFFNRKGIPIHSVKKRIIGLNEKITELSIKFTIKNSSKITIDLSLDYEMELDSLSGHFWKTKHSQNYATESSSAFYLNELGERDFRTFKIEYQNSYREL